MPTPLFKKVKYNSLNLYQKGVMLEIEGLPIGQFKNVEFEFRTSTAHIDMFEISAKFMGVKMDTVELDFQDLLKLQQDGVIVMKMYGKAKFVVNQLVALIKKKFYGK